MCVTAFGKFNGVANNPTEVRTPRRPRGGRHCRCKSARLACSLKLWRRSQVVLKELPAYLRANRLPQNVSVDRVKLLEVSADGSLEELQEQRQTAILGAEETRIWLHLGVDSGAKGFKLERSAWNEAAFRVPDERGWQPASQPISERHGSTSTCLRTRLPVRVRNVYRRVGRNSRTPLLPASFAGAHLQRNRALTAPGSDPQTSRLCAALRKQGFEVAVSDDPGRFVCNWIFFNSLCACREKDDTEEELGRGDETVRRSPDLHR